MHLAIFIEFVIITAFAILTTISLIAFAVIEAISIFLSFFILQFFVIQTEFISVFLVVILKALLALEQLFMMLANLTFINYISCLKIDLMIMLFLLCLK